MNPCRFAFHEIENQKGHIDLFIKIDGSEMLETYEISQEYFRTISDFLKKDTPIFAGSDESSPSALPLLKKNQHRQKYFDYTGKISDNRGNLVHMGYGYVKNYTDLLKFISMSR